MPERKGRKRKPARDRNRGGAPSGSTGAAIDTPRPPPATSKKNARDNAANQGPLPSNFARVTGLVLAVVTAVVAAGVVYDGATSGGGIDGIAKMVVGVLLIALAFVVGVLSVVPGMVRDYFQRRRS